MSKPTTSKVSITDIHKLEDTQCRDWVCQATLDDYVEAMKDGQVFPPVVLFHDGKGYWAADGHHRIRAAMELGIATIDAEVRTGGKREAILHGVGANCEHGLRRTISDKRHCVRLLLSDKRWTKQSDRWIARTCRVSQPFVGEQRRRLEAENGHETAPTSDNVITLFPEPPAKGGNVTTPAGGLGAAAPDAAAENIIPSIPTPSLSIPCASDVLDALRDLVNSIPLGDQQKQSVATLKRCYAPLAFAASVDPDAGMIPKSTANLVNSILIPARALLAALDAVGGWEGTAVGAAQRDLAHALDDILAAGAE